MAHISLVECPTSPSNRSHAAVRGLEICALVILAKSFQASTYSPEPGKAVSLEI